MLTNRREVNGTTVKTSRLAYLDNLKALMIIFVIMVHTGVTYGGIGMWYYTEPRPLTIASRYFFSFIGSFTQAYFMSLLFFIAAYFVPRSLERRGAKNFIKARLFRLGVPTLIFVFLVDPLVVKLSHPTLNLVNFYINGLTSFSFLSWTGPMWFALVLLLFSIIYVPLDSLVNKLVQRFSFAINVTNVLSLISFITCFAFAIRLIYPIGTAVINLQFCYFAAYVVMFFLGAIAYKKNLLEKISYKKGKGWLFAVLFFSVPLWFFVAHFVIGPTGIIASMFKDMQGGWHGLAFLFALTESFICVAVIVGLLGVFKEKFNSQNRLQKFLSKNSFAVYVFHPLILVSTSMLLKNVNIIPVGKFFIVIAIVTPVSFIMAALIKKVRILNKIFA